MSHVPRLPSETEVWDLLIKSNILILWILRRRKIRFTEVVWPTKVTQLDDGEIKVEPKTSDFLLPQLAHRPCSLFPEGERTRGNMEYRDPNVPPCAERSV